MDITAFVFLVLFTAVGVTALFFNAPGNLILFLGTILFSWFTDFQILTWCWIWIFFGLYLLGEIADMALSLFGAKAFGASRKALWGGFIGGVAGSFLGFFAAGVGMLPGLFLGIFAGIFVFEYVETRKVMKSVKASVGGVAGAFLSLLFKLVLGLTITGLLIWRIWEFYGAKGAS